MPIRCLLLTLFFLNSVMAKTDPKVIMVSPADNSFFEIRDRPRDLRITFKRPDPQLRYKLEIILNGRKIVDHFTVRDSFKIRLGRFDHELRWRVQAFDHEDKLVLPNDFATLKVHHNERLRKIDLTLDRHSFKDKLILNWQEQEECSSYDIVLGQKKFGVTKKLGALINEQADPVTIKIICSDDQSHYGAVDLGPKKILASSFLYEFYVTGLWFKQDMDVPYVKDKGSNENYVMQVHGLGWQLHWDKKKRNDVSTFLRYGRMLTFGQEAELFEMDVRFRFDFGLRIKEKMLIEFEGQRFSYYFDDEFSAKQDISFINAGFETYFGIGNKVIKSALLLKKELQSSSFSPAFKLRFHLPYTKKLSWTAEFDYSNFESELDTSELKGGTENTITQFKAGISYLFW